jgi:hypothetical protein
MGGLTNQASTKTVSPHFSLAERILPERVGTLIDGCRQES